MKLPILGAHVSVAGGLPTAFERATDLGCTAIQIFVKNNNRWVGRALLEPEVEAFRAAHDASSVGPVVAHTSYLINLAAQAPETLRKSRQSLLDEIERCDRLGVGDLVLHPGSHVGAGEEAGLALITESLNHVFRNSTHTKPRILLEITAGQGTNLGFELEQLATLLAASEVPERLGVCIDTCHAFAAGYAIHEEAGYRDFMGSLERTVGLGKVGCLHLNDSAKPYASRRDRHANLGEGEIGYEALARLVLDPAWGETPMILETPTGENQTGHSKDLEWLRGLVES